MSNGEKRKMRNLILFFLTLFIIGCGKEPNDVGFGLLPEKELFNVNFYEDSIEVQFENITNFISNSASNYLLIGNYDNISCGILIRFDIPDTLRFAQIKSSRIRLFKSDFVIGDTTVPAKFTAHKVLSNYYDTLYDARVVGEFEGIPDSVNYFPIDTSVVREWFMGQNYGLYLKPQNNGVIWGFKSLDEMLFTPALEVGIGKADGGVDTVRFFYGSDGYIARSSEIADTNNIIIQAGVGLRSILKFDISKLPKNIIVNRAEISIYLKEKKRYIRGTDSLIASFITDLGLVKKSLGGVEGNYLGVRNPLDTLEYIIPVTTPVQRWLNGEPNNGVLIRFYNEHDNFDRYVFYFRDRKPKLKIYYTTKPGV
jgi:hypothetical protein